MGGIGHRGEEEVDEGREAYSYIAQTDSAYLHIPAAEIEQPPGTGR